MRLLVGLGNPGPEHARNRHNIGFMVVDTIARHHRFGRWRQAFRGFAVEGRIGDEAGADGLRGERVVLLRPETYMNESGNAVAIALRFYRIDVGDLIVFHDEIELPPGKVRVKVGGGNAGHNGLRSISSHIGNDYKRVRIGVGHPGIKDLVQPYVLGDFAKAERPWVEALCDIIAENAGLIAKGEDASFQNKVHLAMQAKGFGAAEAPPDED
jgi:peptidyl-tRNA hydrolase, PTH1 family